MCFKEQAIILTDLKGHYQYMDGRDQSAYMVVPISGVRKKTFKHGETTYLKHMKTINKSGNSWIESCSFSAKNLA